MTWIAWFRCWVHREARWCDNPRQMRAFKKWADEQPWVIKVEPITREEAVRRYGP